MCDRRRSAHLEKILVLGYGNADRQDDGAAWHVLNRLARRLGLEAPPSPHEGLEAAQELQVNGRTVFIQLLFALQLSPEMGETLAEFDRVCFVDAHTGSVPKEIHHEKLQSAFQASPFTHHLTPAACLEISAALYGRCPDAALLSIRGYEFGFTTSLSPRTEKLVDQAAGQLRSWIEHNRF